MDGAMVGNPLCTVGMNVGSVVGMRVDGAYVGDADGAGVGALLGCMSITILCKPSPESFCRGMAPARQNAAQGGSVLLPR